MANVSPRIALRIAACVMLIAIAGCTRTNVQQGQQQNTGGRLARPDVVVIADYTFNPAEVKLDAGVAQRAARAVSSETDAQRQAAIVKKVSDAVTDALVKKVRELGFPAAKVSSGAQLAGGTQFFVGGQFMTIDEGNETRRNTVGLGIGASEVKANTQFSYQAPGGAIQTVQTFVASAQSGRKPGAAETLGAGAAVAAVAATDVASETLSTDVKSLSEKMAGEIGKQLSDTFKKNGWIAR
jgi:hypothetical protein